LGFKVSLGVLSCPDCGGVLYYSGVKQIEIFDARCLSCGKEWWAVKYPDGRREIREKITN